MTNYTECPQCGSPIKNIPAGVAKATGKPYGAFQACSANCGWKPPKEGFHKPMSPAQQNRPMAEEKMTKEDWQEKARGQVRHHFWLELFKYQLSRGDYDEQIKNKQMSGVIGVYVEKVMGEGRGATAQELFPDSKLADINF